MTVAARRQPLHPNDASRGWPKVAVCQHCGEQIVKAKSDVHARGRALMLDAEPIPFSIHGRAVEGKLVAVGTAGARELPVGGHRWSDEDIYRPHRCAPMREFYNKRFGRYER